MKPLQKSIASRDWDPDTSNLMPAPRVGKSKLPEVFHVAQVDNIKRNSATQNTTRVKNKPPIPIQGSYPTMQSSELSSPNQQKYAKQP